MNVEHNESSFLKMLDPKTDINERKFLLTSYIPQRIGLVASLTNETEIDEEFLTFALSQFVIKKQTFNLDELIKIISRQQKFMELIRMLILYEKDKLSLEEKQKIITITKLDQNLQTLLLN
ncbi:MAG: hypothetical protein WCR30_03515 [Clostridia bacterium]